MKTRLDRIESFVKIPGISKRDLSLARGIIGVIREHNFTNRVRRSSKDPKKPGLMQQFKIEDRPLRTIIAWYSKFGYPVGSEYNVGSYWWAESYSELELFKENMDRRALPMLQRKAAYQQMQDEMTVGKPQQALAL